MPVTTLDPKTALVVIDLQKGVVAAPTAQPIDVVLSNAGALADAFRAKRLPVVLVNVGGAAPGRTETKRPRMEPPADWMDFVPELKQQPTDHVVTKYAWGAFSNTELATYLRDQGVTQIVLAGISTSVGVESTARYAYEHGFNVTLALDAISDRSAEAHAYSTTQIFPKLGETGATQEILKLLAADA